MPVKLAVFDITGTTVADDNAVASAFRKAFQLYDFDLPEEEIKSLRGYKKTAAIQIMLEKIGVAFDEDLVADIHREFEIEMMDHYEYSPEVRAMAGAESVMLILKEKGIRIALNTGFTKSIAQTILSRLQWIDRGLVDDYIASDEVEEGRPQPYMIQALMERAGIDDPREVVKIGDTEVDIIEGINAGCLMVVAVTTGAFTKDQLEQHSPDYIIDNLSELPALILNGD